MTIPVVVVHHRAPAWCAASVQALLESGPVDLHVVVVDNSGELALPRHQLPAGVEVVRAGSNLGFAGGANLGIRTALARFPASELVLVCAHDFHPEGDAVGQLVAAMADHPDVGILAPRFGPPRASVGGRWDGRRAENLAPTGAERGLVESDWLCGTGLVLRVACLARIGGFDERFGSYVEDVDLCLRAHDAGWRVATLADASGHGLGSASDDKHRLMLRNGALLVAKRRGRAAAQRLLLAYVGAALRQGLAMALRPDRARRPARARAVRCNLGVAAELLASRDLGEWARSGPASGPAVTAADEGQRRTR